MSTSRSCDNKKRTYYDQLAAQIVAYSEYPWMDTVQVFIINGYTRSDRVKTTYSAGVYVFTDFFQWTDISARERGLHLPPLPRWKALCIYHGIMIESFCEEGYNLKRDYKFRTCQYGEMGQPASWSKVKADSS